MRSKMKTMHWYYLKSFIYFLNFIFWFKMFLGCSVAKFSEDKADNFDVL